MHGNPTLFEQPAVRCPPRGRIASRRRYPPGSFYWRPAAPDRFESGHCAAQGLEFEPGEKWNYSNSGYVLLGYPIEKISGKIYNQFVQDESIFTPLGMKDLGYDSNSAIIERRASVYSPSPKGPVNAGFIHMSIPFAAGSLYSTTEDLLRWEQGLFGGKLLSAASLQKMIMPFKSDYAFGLGVRTVGWTQGDRSRGQDRGLQYSSGLPSR